jgi:hypothetical protein
VYLLTNDWYTSAESHLLVAKKGTTFRRSDAKYTSADVHASDEYVEGRLYEPVAVATPTGQSNTYLPKFRTTQYNVGRWQEILLLQTARNLYPAMGVCSTTEATPNVHDITIRTTQDPVNMGRHWERENVTPAESERIDIIGLSLNSLHIECSEAFPIAVQTLDWNCNFTLNNLATTPPDEITPASLTDAYFDWSMFTFPTLTYNGQTLECDVVGWSFDIQNTVRISGLDSNGYYTKAKYVPLTMIATTLEIVPYGHNVFELLRTANKAGNLESYATDMDLTVKMARNATTDYIQFTHLKTYCVPYTLSALKRPGSIERYYLRFNQLNTGSLAIQAKDAYNDDYYENP